MQPEKADKQRIIITGATSLIGHFLLPRLKLTAHTIFVFSRSKHSSPDINWYQFDGSSLSSNPSVQRAEVLIHLGPLYALPALVDDFITLGGKRIITFSSTSRFSKLESDNSSERKVALALLAAEETVSSKCAQHNISWTIFRPTLIYGTGLDNNVSSIARFIKRFGFFPLVGAGSGLRQPVHADDLAAACLMVINNEQTFDQAYNLVGSETLSYKEMVRRIFIVLNRKPCFIPVPLSFFRIAMKCASWLPAYSHITPDMANRMNEALCFDSDPAIRDFGYKSRGFRPIW